MKILRLEEVTSMADLHYEELTPEELAEVYRLGRESFTAADWQEVTERDLQAGFPADELLAELEEIQRQQDQKQQGHQKAS
jgi:hypothetical protein